MRSEDAIYFGEFIGREISVRIAECKKLAKTISFVVVEKVSPLQEFL